MFSNLIVKYEKLRCPTQLVIIIMVMTMTHGYNSLSMKFKLSEPTTCSIKTYSCTSYTFHIYCILELVYQSVYLFGVCPLPVQILL